MAASVGGLLWRFRLTRLAERHDSALVMGAFAFVNGCLGIAVMSAVALATGSPFVFPSLGPTAFLHFYTAMRSEEHTSELQSLMRITYDIFCLIKKHYKCSYEQ